MRKITDDTFIRLYRELYSKEFNYIETITEYQFVVRLLIDYLQPKTVLHYGCGRGALIRRLPDIYPKVFFYGYDPSIRGYDEIVIKNADLIICDALEHITANLLSDVLEHISTISKNAFFVLDHALSDTALPDGQNVHCTVRPLVWYQIEIMKAFGEAITILPGYEPHSSCVATFPLHPHIIKEYHEIIKKDK